MMHAAPSRARLRPTFEAALGLLADRGMVLAFAASAANAGYALGVGALPHWAAVAGAAVSAAYLTLPHARTLARGDLGSLCPPEALASARRCIHEAHRCAESGIWAVTEHATGKVSFMSERAFVDFAAGLPDDVDLAIVEAHPDGFHVKRYLNGVLASGAEAAHTVYAWDGTILRQMDYEAGECLGERGPSGSPAIGR
jgi:hypothetical protein